MLRRVLPFHLRLRNHINGAVATEKIGKVVSPKNAVLHITIVALVLGKKAVSVQLKIAVTESQIKTYLRSYRSASQLIGYCESAPPKTKMERKMAI